MKLEDALNEFDRNRLDRINAVKNEFEILNQFWNNTIVNAINNLMAEFPEHLRDYWNFPTFMATHDDKICGFKIQRKEHPHERFNVRLVSGTVFEAVFSFKDLNKQANTIHYSAPGREEVELSISNITTSFLLEEIKRVLHMMKGK